MKKTSIIKALTALLMISAPAAHAITLDFEGFAAGTVMDDEYQASLGVTISAVNNDLGHNYAAIFDSNNPTGGDGDLGAPFNEGQPDELSPGNILIIQEDDAGCAGGICTTPDDEGTRFNDKPTGTITFMFDQVIELLTMDFFDVETDENGTQEINEIRLFNSSGVQIFDNDYHTPDTGGNRLWDQVVFGPGNGVGISGIRKIEVNFAGSGALDNVTYNVVPVPASVWLFGTALLGFIGYSRRRSV